MSSPHAVLCCFHNSKGMSLETVGWEKSTWQCGECNTTGVVKNQTLTEHYRQEHPEVLGI